MSDILKTSAYKFNNRNGVYSQLGDYIEVTRALGPIGVEDPADVWYIVNFWVKFDSGTITGDTAYQGIFNLGNRFWCYFRFFGGGFSSLKMYVLDWKRTGGGLDVAETFELTNSISSADVYDHWEMWSVVVKGVHDAINGEDILVYRNGSSLAITESSVVGVSLTFPQEAWWTISGPKRGWPLGGGGGLDIEYYPIDLTASITDFSTMLGETIDHATIVPFLYNNGIGRDVTEYTPLALERVGFYLPLRDGWMNTRRPGKGRYFSDDDGFVGRSFFNATQSTQERHFFSQGVGRRPLTSRDMYLSHTRSNNKFVQRNVPEFDHQNAWIGKSIPVTDFPDAEGI